MDRRVTFSPLQLAMLGAAALWASLPPLDLWPLAWFAPVPWIVLIRREKLDGRRPYLLITLAGFCFWLGALHWLRLPHPATSIGWAALSFYFAFYLPAFVWLARVAVHRLRVPVILAAPVVWTGLEFARGHLLTGMTMASLGHTQYRWIDIIQISDLTGAYGVSFLVMLVAASVGRMLPCGERRWAIWPVAPAVLMIAATIFYGRMRADSPSASPGPKIALIQGSVDIKFSDSFEEFESMRNKIFTEYLDLSRDALKKDPKIDLIAWPESMFYDTLVTFAPDAAVPADYPNSEPEFRRWLADANRQSMKLLADTAKSLGVPLLLGANVRHFGQQGDESMTSAVYVDRDGRLLGRYDKMHLVMFGEYIPLADYIPWLYRLTPLTGSAAPGKRAASFQLQNQLQSIRIAPSICYENVLPHFIRRQVNELTAEGLEPDVLVNLTNDGWFWGSSELNLHLMCAVFRAVECRKPFLIAANTGFSASIDSSGRILEQGPRRAKAVIIAQPRIDRGLRSWYLVWGDLFAWLCLAASIACVPGGVFYTSHGQ